MPCHLRERRIGLLPAVVAVHVLLMVATTAGCFRSKGEGNGALPDGQQRTLLRVGFRPGALLDVTPIVIAESRGEDKVLRVDLVPISSPADGIAKFRAGEIDVVAGLPMEVIFSQVEGSKDTVAFRVYALQCDTRDGWVGVVAHRDAGVRHIKDLAGKTVASLPTDQAEWLLRRILVANGIPVRDVKTTRYSGASPLSGLRSGEHKGLFGPDPAIAMALAEGHTLLERGVISRYLYGGRRSPVSASIVSTSFIEKNPAAFRRFLELVDEATQRVNGDPAAVRPLFAREEYGGFSPDVRGRMLFPLMSRPEPESVGVASQMAQELAGDGLLKQHVNLEDLFLSGSGAPNDLQRSK